MRKLSLGLAAFLATTGGVSAAQAAKLYMGVYPDGMIVVDEANGKVTDRIKLPSGLPTSLRQSNDRKLIYVTTITNSGVDVVDVASKKVINSFSLNTPQTRYRFNAGVPDPTGRYFYTIMMQIDKKIDHFEISKPKYAIIDLQLHKVAKMFDVAPEDEAANAGSGGRSTLVLSDDGKYLYQFRDKVIVLDTTDFKVVERIDLAKPAATGLENVGFGGELPSIREPGRYTALFNAAGPYINNKMFGVAKFNLNTRQFDFTPIGPAPSTLAGLQVSPDGKTAYTVATHETLGNKRCEFWRFDMTTNALQGKSEFDCKSRFSFGMSGDGQKLYIYGASYDLEIYDAKTLKHEKTYDLQNDVTGGGMVIAGL